MNSFTIWLYQSVSDTVNLTDDTVNDTVNTSCDNLLNKDLYNKNGTLCAVFVLISSADDIVHRTL